MLTIRNKTVSNKYLVQLTSFQKPKNQLHPYKWLLKDGVRRLNFKQEKEIHMEICLFLKTQTIITQWLCSRGQMCIPKSCQMKIISL